MQKSAAKTALPSMQKSPAKTASLPIMKSAAKTASLPMQKSAAKTESSFHIYIYTYIFSWVFTFSPPFNMNFVLEIYGVSHSIPGSSNKSGYFFLISASLSQVSSSI
jgi:hypothetical protein